MKISTVTLESMSQAVWYNIWTLEKFKNYLTGDILEVGCGIGNFTDLLTNYGNVWVIDIDKNNISKTKKVSNKVLAGIGDIEKGRYFFNNQKFDSIVCLNVLEHIKDDTAALNNLFNLLKAGGILILLVPVHQFLYGEIDKSIGHFRRYNKSDIINSLKNIGFKIIKSRRLNFLGALGWFIAGKILKKRQIDKGNIRLFNVLAPFFLFLEDLVEPEIGTSVLIIGEKR